MHIFCVGYTSMWLLSLSSKLQNLLMLQVLTVGDPYGHCAILLKSQLLNINCFRALYFILMTILCQRNPPSTQACISDRSRQKQPIKDLFRNLERELDCHSK